jgi:hypothetical protein
MDEFISNLREILDFSSYMGSSFYVMQHGSACITFVSEKILLFDFYFQSFSVYERRCIARIGFWKPKREYLLSTILGPVFLIYYLNCRHWVRKLSEIKLELVFGESKVQTSCRTVFYV